MRDRRRTYEIHRKWIWFISLTTATTYCYCHCRLPFRRRNTSARCLRWSSKVWLAMIMSSRYTRTLGSSSGPRTKSSSRWNVAGAECNLNGIVRNCMSPLPGTVNAVAGRLSGASGTCQYPFFKSRVDRYFAPLNLSRVAVMCGNGYTSFSVTAFNRRKSMQQRWPPSFFRTTTIGELQALWDGSITPSCSIFSTSALITACIAEFLGRYRCLNGWSVFNRILCSIRSTVGPNLEKLVKIWKRYLIFMKFNIWGFLRSLITNSKLELKKKTKWRTIWWTQMFKHIKFNRNNI